MITILKPRSTLPRASDQPGVLGRFSFIINERAYQHFWSGTGSLSVKSFHGGEAIYNVGRGRYRIDQESYLILNQAQPYEIEVDVKKPLESFCVFFEDGFAEEVCYTLNTPANQLLGNPDISRQPQISFFERTYRHDGILSPALYRLKASLPDKTGDELWINQQLHEIIERLLRVHRKVYREVESLPALRAATREELYRRLHLAKDFISASSDQALSVDDMAGVACLSPSHFLRTFKQAFQQTPHQFLMAKRLERARRFLLQTDLPVTEICFAIGFESLGSFSSLFRRQFGVSPSRYRQKR